MAEPRGFFTSKSFVSFAAAAMPVLWYSVPCRCENPSQWSSPQNRSSLWQNDRGYLGAAPLSLDSDLLGLKFLDRPKAARTHLPLRNLRRRKGRDSTEEAAISRRQELHHRNTIVSNFAHHVDGAIKGGGSATAGEFPYFCAPVGYALCGATLIWEDMILSAAHCSGVFEQGVFVGAVNLFGHDSSERYRKVTAEVIHPDFAYSEDPFVMDYDFMVLKLDKPVKDITPVPLNKNHDNPYNGQRTRAIGFGVSALEDETPSNVLMKVDISVVRQAKCASQFSMATEVDEETMICAGEKGENICNGDSGGPLLDQEGMQIGVTSFRSDCNVFPSVFARVSAAYPWIHAQLCSLSANPPGDCILTEVSAAEDPGSHSPSPVSTRSLQPTDSLPLQASTSSSSEDNDEDDNNDGDGNSDGDGYGNGNSDDNDDDDDDDDEDEYDDEDEDEDEYEYEYDDDDDDEYDDDDDDDDDVDVDVDVDDDYGNVDDGYRYKEKEAVEEEKEEEEEDTESESESDTESETESESESEEYVETEEQETEAEAEEKAESEADVETEELKQDQEEQGEQEEQEKQEEHEEKGEHLDHVEKVDYQEYQDHQELHEHQEQDEDDEEGEEQEEEEEQKHEEEQEKEDMPGTQDPKSAEEQERFGGRRRPDNVQIIGNARVRRSRPRAFFAPRAMEPELEPEQQQQQQQQARPFLDNFFAV